LSQLSAEQRFEHAATLRDRIATLVRACARMQRLAGLTVIAELVAARPDGAGGWELSVVRHGRLAAAGVAPRGTSPFPVIEALLATADVVAPRPGPLPAALAEETEAILRWLEETGTRPGAHVDALVALCPRCGPPRRLSGHRWRPTRSEPIRRPPITADAGPSRSSVSRCGGPTMSAMITAIVMVSVETDKIPEVAEQLAALDGVSEVYSVAGDVDLVVIVRVREFEQIAEVIAGQLSKVGGVLHTDTHIAFRAYSRHDLDSAFAIGFEAAD
jgi:DNA-binding Lrp family transcriptional regulator